MSLESIVIYPKELLKQFEPVSIDSGNILDNFTRTFAPDGSEGRNAGLMSDAMNLLLDAMQYDDLIFTEMYHSASQWIINVLRKVQEKNNSHTFDTYLRVIEKNK